jgi:molecular chaperone HtpG
MQRLLRRSGREGAGFSAPVLEVNPAHPLIAELAKGDPAKVPDVAAALLDLARIQDGDLPSDPGAFARRVTDLLAAAHRI